MPPTLFIIASQFAPIICGDATQDKIDQIVRNRGPWWKIRAIYETLKSGDRDAWTIVALVVGGIALLTIARIVKKKVLSDD